MLGSAQEHSHINSPTHFQHRMEREHTPGLFADAPDKTAEALRSFVNVAECTYALKHLGLLGQKETMSCDCAEDWDEVAAVNRACGEDSHCINRVTSVECVNRQCLCGDDCQNQRFQKREYSAVKVVQTEKKGYGLVAAAPIGEQQLVMEYVGEVIDEQTFRLRMVDYDAQGLRHFYFMMLTKDAFIDATAKGSLARFCNHSCLPNAYVDKWVVGDKLRMGIFAKTPIRAGDEITFDYNVDRYGAQLQPCYCGASNCLGWMGGKTQTDAALLLPAALAEALGVTAQHERAWLREHKLLRAKTQAENATVNEDFVKLVEVLPLTELDVTRAMSALMKVDEPCIVDKLVDRVYLTTDAKIHSLIVKLHGYKTFLRVLKEHGTREPLVGKILTVLKRWPSMTRNKIELSQIEDVVRDICALLLDDAIITSAQELLAEWSKLEMAYRIPKHEKPLLPLFGRNPRLELPVRSVLVENGDDDEPLPDGWEKALDENTNTVYYYHTGLGLSKWERPTAVVPRGPKKVEKPKVKNGAREFARPVRRTEEADLARLHEERLQKEKELQFNEVLQKEKLLQELILQSQKDAEEKKRLEQQAKKDKMDKYKERKRRKEAAALKHASKAALVSPEALWTSTLARYVPNLIKKHEKEIGHDNIKGCARELVKVLAAKEAKKDPAAKPPKELDAAKIKKLKEFCSTWMEKFLAKYTAKRAKHGAQ